VVVLHLHGPRHQTQGQCSLVSLKTGSANGVAAFILVLRAGDGQFISATKHKTTLLICRSNACIDQ